MKHVRGKDHIGNMRPWTQPEDVLPIFVCLQFPNGTLYAGSVDTILRFDSRLIEAAHVSIRNPSDALRWAAGLLN